jgi:DNA-binding transcriptional LysR family regulator
MRTTAPGVPDRAAGQCVAIELTTKYVTGYVRRFPRIARSGCAGQAGREGYSRGPMKRLPPLHALRAFDASVRTGSFTRAGDALHVTQGAISRQIKQLEDWLGKPVFVRHYQGLILTPAGSVLAQSLEAAFGTIQDAVEQIQHLGARQRIAVNVPETFASRWLAPRLRDFHGRHPDIDLAITTSAGHHAARRPAVRLPGDVPRRALGQGPQPAAAPGALHRRGQPRAVGRRRRAGPGPPHAAACAGRHRHQAPADLGELVRLAGHPAYRRRGRALRSRPWTRPSMPRCRAPAWRWSTPRWSSATWPRSACSASAPTR